VQCIPYERLDSLQGATKHFQTSVKTLVVTAIKKCIIYIYLNSRTGKTLNNFSLENHKEIPVDAGYISVEICFRRALPFPRDKAAGA